MRCGWPGDDSQYIAYHDTEWGVPETDSRALFEKLILDGFQAGLSWITILKKRDGFRQAFDGFEPDVIAQYAEKDVRRLLGNAGIIRHRGKIEAAIGNARAYLQLREAGRDFNAFCWQHVDGQPLINRFKTLKDIPAETKESRALSKALKQAGFKFCGPVIVYAFMQAVGMVNDHLVDCPEHEKCRKLAEKHGRTP